MNQRKYFIKILSLIIAVIYVWETVVWSADGEFAPSFRVPVKNTGEGVLFDVPFYLGSIRDMFKANPSVNALPSVIIIEDAHCNYGAQRNISSLVGYVSAAYGVKYVLLEGAGTPIDVSYVRTLAADTRDRVLDFYMRKGDLTGPEKCAMEKADGIELGGLEDMRLYEKTRAAFLSALEDSKQYEADLGRVLRALKRIKRAVYSHELSGLDELRSAYDSGRISIKTYCGKLEEIIAQSGRQRGFSWDDGGLRRELGPEKLAAVTRFRELLGAENNLPFDDARDEFRELVKTVIDALNASEEKSDILRFGEFIRKIADKEIDNADFHRLLLREASRMGINTAPYSEYMRYVSYVEELCAIDTKALVKALELAESRLRGLLYENDDEKTVDRYCDFTALALKVARLAVSDEEWEEYKSLKCGFSAREIREFAGRHGEQIPVPGAVPGAERFYRLARAREKAMFRNIRKSAGRKAPCAAVMGGFHTEGIARMCRLAGISYAVIMPRVDREANRDIYYARLKNEQSPLDKFLNERIGILKGADISRVVDKLVSGERRIRLNPRAFTAMGQDLIDKDILALENPGDNTVYVDGGREITQTAPDEIRLFRRHAEEGRVDKVKEMYAEMKALRREFIAILMIEELEGTDGALAVASDLLADEITGDRLGLSFMIENVLRSLISRAQNPEDVFRDVSGLYARETESRKNLLHDRINKNTALLNEAVGNGEKGVDRLFGAETALAKITPAIRSAEPLIQAKIGIATYLLGAHEKPAGSVGEGPDWVVFRRIAALILANDLKGFRDRVRTDSNFYRNFYNKYGHRPPSSIVLNNRRLNTDSVFMETFTMVYLRGVLKACHIALSPDDFEDAEIEYNELRRQIGAIFRQYPGQMDGGWDYVKGVFPKKGKTAFADMKLPKKLLAVIKFSALGLIGIHVLRPLVYKALKGCLLSFWHPYVGLLMSGFVMVMAVNICYEIIANPVIWFIKREIYFTHKNREKRHARAMYHLMRDDLEIRHEKETLSGIGQGIKDPVIAIMERKKHLKRDSLVCKTDAAKVTMPPALYSYSD
ncbi:MAG: hypothetical protein ABH885_03530, partial [Candidatus Omnitrophota bacterium]